MSNAQYLASLVNSSGNINIPVSNAGINFNNSSAIGASTLTDYEVGTWTPTYTPSSGSFSSITYQFQNGNYTKIGNTVFAYFFLGTTSISVGTGSGAINIGGLPFSNINVTNAQRSSGSVNNVSGFNSGKNPIAVTSVSQTTTMQLFYQSSAGGSMSQVQVSDLGTGSSSNDITGLFIYQANF